MSYSQFPATPYVKTFNSAGSVENLGSFQTTRNAGLAYIVLTLLKRGAAVGSEQVRLRIYPTALLETPLYTTGWITLADAGIPSASSWTGTYAFQVSPALPVNKNLSYYVVAETQNYTKTATFFLGAVLDFHSPVYTAAQTNKRGAQMRLIGYRDVLAAAEDIGDMGGEVKRMNILEGVTISAPADLQVAVNVPVTWSTNDSPKTVTVSAYVADARLVAWTLCKGSGSNYEQIGCVITKPSATQVTIQVDIDLAAGTYYLQGAY